MSLIASRTFIVLVYLLTKKPRAITRGFFDYFKLPAKLFAVSDETPLAR